MRFIIEESDEILTTHSGLALVGLLLEKTALSTRLDALSVPTRAFTDIANHEVAYSYLGSERNQVLDHRPDSPPLRFFP